jgi:transcriptional regulator with GAF, ATPase, and Fis domain
MKTTKNQAGEGRMLGGRYRVERLLEKRGQQSVYVCRDSKDGNTRAALRILRFSESATGATENLSRELSLLQRLRHPNLARILDFGIIEDTGNLFWVEEWIEGKNCYAGTDESDTEGTLNLISELCNTIQYLHSRGIVHGNLEPSNLILSNADGRTGILKVLNYGLLYYAKSPPQNSGCGTRAYTAPEVLLGGMPTAKSDIYSLGVLIYQLLARRLPFEDEDQDYLIQKHLHGSVEMHPVERLNGGAHLSQLIRRLLAKKPEKRPASCDEILAIISTVLGSESPGAKTGELERYFSASRFVGREREMPFLQERAERVLESGRGWTVFVSGEAGSGKTRCMEELKSWATLKRWRVIEASCGTGEETPYEPYRQVLSLTDPDKGPAIFRFDELPRVAESGVLDSYSGPAAGQFRDLLAREILRRLSKRPTLFLLHDFHRADKATCTVLDYLSSDIQAHPVFMCVSFRSGEDERGAIDRVVDLTVRQGRAEILPLGPLNKENVLQLVSGISGDSRLEKTLGSWIFGKVGGNPFFLEEMLKHLVEQGMLFRKNGEWEFVESNLKKLKTPAGIGSVLRRRLARLSSSARDLADWLAVFHKPVPIRLLCSAMGRCDSDISAAIEELLSRQMIRLETKESGESVGFSHDLIAEIIRGDLPDKLRCRMHRRIAEAIEREHGEDSPVQELAMHYIEGKSKDSSMPWVFAAASQSRAEFAHEIALRCYEHIFKNRRRLSDETLCLAAIEASDAMLALGLPKRAIRFLKSEMLKSKKIGTDLKARMFMQLALSYQHLGDLTMQQACCRRGLRLFRNRRKDGPNLTKAMLWAELAFPAVLKSRPRRGLIYLDRALRSCPDKTAEALKGRIQSLAASLQRVGCNLQKALAAGANAASILGQSRESHLACSAFSTLGFVLLGLGRFPLALEKHRQAVLLSKKSRSVILSVQALANLAECLCRMGRLQESIHTMERACESVAESGNPAIRYAFNTIWAEIRLAAGDYSGVCRLFDQLDHEADRNLARFTVGHARYIKANLNFTLGNFPEALKHIGKMRDMETREAPFYERELAEALRARILFERGSAREALRLLHSLDRAVTQKRWPYQMCIIELHIGEILLRQRQFTKAEKYARNSFRLARAMHSVPLIGHSRLLLGLIYSSLRNSCVAADDLGLGKSTGGKASLERRSLKELRLCCETTDPLCPADVAWRAHAELCRIYGSMSQAELGLTHAARAYELLCKMEDRVPSEMLPAFYGAFGRSNAKLELVRLIESGKEQKRNRSIQTAQIQDQERTRMLLRVSATVNTIRKPDMLLEAILDQLIPAVEVERALVFLRDEATGKLRLAKGRNRMRECLSGTETTNRSILEAVFTEGKPIVSADVQQDSRIRRESKISARAGKLFCAPLKVSGRVMGILYADHPTAEKSLSESVINLFAAFCNLAAIALDNALAHQHLAKEKRELEQYLHHAREAYPEIIGNSAPVEALRDRIGLAAKSPLDILIVGESGTGKELVVQAIYRTGGRKSGKFIPVDCGSLADSLAEAEFFGYRKGSFTGAAENRHGLLEAAHGGILFLDEISNLPFRLQAKLLRVLQEREVRRIGETTPRKIDIQVIAATNKDLFDEIKAGRFREDLFYRLKEMEIRVPPLRERLEDVPVLIQWFLEETAERGGGYSKKMLPEALNLLMNYTYPGNIRELKNIVSGSYFSTAGTTIGPKDLPPEVRGKFMGEVEPESNEAGRLYREILQGPGSFEDIVKKPFLRRQFGAPLVRSVIQSALKDAGGVYRNAFARLRIPDRSYAVTMQFLKRNKCYVDYRPFRRSRF